MSAMGIEDDARAYGFRKTTDPKNHKVHWQIVCKKCKKVEEHGWGPTTSPDLMVRNMRVRGWEISDKATPKCKECRKPIRWDKPTPLMTSALVLTPPPLLEEIEAEIRAEVFVPPTAPPVVEIRSVMVEPPSWAKTATAAASKSAISDALLKAVETRTAKAAAPQGVIMSLAEFEQLKAFCNEMVHRLTKYQELFTRLSNKSNAEG